jgi:SOS response regulatory protein OraA/RecX
LPGIGMSGKADRLQRLAGELARHLDRWPKTGSQAFQWLSSRGVGEEEAYAIIETLTETGYLDDTLYARLFVEGHGNWGRFRLARELRARGIPDGIARRAIAEVSDPGVIHVMVRDWRKAGIDDRRIACRLIRRGFPAVDVANALMSSCPGEE